MIHTISDSPSALFRLPRHCRRQHQPQHRPIYSLLFYVRYNGGNYRISVPPTNPSSAPPHSPQRLQPLIGHSFELLSGRSH